MKVYQLYDTMSGVKKLTTLHAAITFPTSANEALTYTGQWMADIVCKQAAYVQQAIKLNDILMEQIILEVPLLMSLWFFQHRYTRG